MKKLILMLTLTLASVVSYAQNAEIFSNKKGAINGYDVVAYFKESKPVKGDTQFKYQWKDTNWYFSSNENLETFKANPEKYTPQYGGFCAYGTSEGHKAPTEPDAWTIVEGKLYLNYNKDVKSLWNKNQRELIKKADDNWGELKAKKEKV
jgi:YHS domain-containing protein